MSTGVCMKNGIWRSVSYQIRQKGQNVLLKSMRPCQIKFTELNGLKCIFTGPVLDHVDIIKTKN